MKLLDFTLDSALNELRREMGAEFTLIEFESKVLSPLRPDEIEALAREGLEIPSDQVEVLKDGTLGYKGRRVVVYIRDVSQYRASDLSLPRYHIADCDTLHTMRASNRYAKYVVATRETGVFQINLKRFNSAEFEKKEEQLRVCQNCLTKLNWDKFAELKHIAAKKEQIVTKFTLKEFFSKYGITFVSGTPMHTEATAPRNEYTADFPEVAKRLKQKRGYKCQQCGIDLSLYSKFLHAHHVNGLKYENDETNLILLCIEHHSMEAGHDHMGNSSQLNEFLRMKADGRFK